MHIRPFAALSVAALAVAACSSSGTTTPTGTAAFSATIDGTQWTSVATSTSAHGFAGGTFTLIGSTIGSNQLSLSLTMYNVTGPGTYSLGTTQAMFGGTATLVAASGLSWTTPLSGTAGTVTLSSVSATHITGTFSFVAAAVPGQAASTRTVTNGSFDLDVTSSGSVTVPDGKGSKISGTIGGTTFNSDVMVLASAPSSGLLALAIGNDVYTINIFVGGLSGVGTYPMGPSSGQQRSVNVATTDGTLRTWGFSNANTAGTFTISTLSSTRMTGSYAFTLQPGGATPGALTLVGTFSIGLQ